jgi:hypothetical protein
VAACVAILALLATVSASASTLASGFNARTPAATAVEPAQYSTQRRVAKRKKRGRRPHSRRESARDSDAKRPSRTWKRHRVRRLRLPRIRIAPEPDDDDPPSIGSPRRRPPQQQAPPRRKPPQQQQQVAAQRIQRQIVALIDQAQPQSLDAELARTHGLQLLRSRPIVLLGARTVLFRVRARRSEAAALAALQGDGRVRSAQFNLRYLHSGDRQELSIPQYGPRKVRLPDAHRLALGRNVAVAVIDSAVDTAHPDLKGATVLVHDAVGDPDAAPDFHGTAVAGIIGSRGVVEGVAPEARIMAVRAFRTRPRALPETTTEILLGAIDWAAGNGARVLNMSFVGPRDSQLQEILRAANGKRIVLVAAAGNGGPKAAPAFPAAYPGVIAVTAVDEKDRRYEQANRGSYITVAAPGVDILAPVERGGRDYLSGTSFATAYVTGVVALLLERDPSLGTAAVAELIAGGADDLGPAGRDDDFGAGRVNALTSLTSMREVAAR